jgi:hypothetical protein
MGEIDVLNSGRKTTGSNPLIRLLIKWTKCPKKLRRVFDMKIKKLVAMVMAGAMAATMALSVSANNLPQSTSGTRYSVAGTAGTNWNTSRSNVANLSVNSGTPQGSNTHLDMGTTSLLQSNFASSNDRRLNVELYERDTVSADDHIRTLTFAFTGRRPNRTVVATNGNVLHTSGSLETDRHGEFFTRWRVNRMTGDPTTPSIASGLFNYEIRLVG